MNTKFTAATFIAIADLATKTALDHCKKIGPETGNYPVTDPTFWYNDPVRIFREQPEVEEALVKIDWAESVLSEMEAYAVFKTAFASACASYFSAKKGAKA